jgi:hypothetical protein
MKECPLLDPHNAGQEQMIQIFLIAAVDLLTRMNACARAARIPQNATMKYGTDS